MKMFGSWSNLLSVLFKKNSQDITLRPNQSTTYTAARDIQLPPGDAAHVLTSADSAQALTNKTISGSSNTLSDVALGSQVTGTLPIANGGTGQTSKTPAFDALAPSTTKGDLIVYDGTDNIRLAAGTDGFALTASSGADSGLAYASVLTNPMTAVGDVIVGGSSGTASRVPSALLGDVTGSAATATVTITIATPGVVSLTAHGLLTGAKIILTTTGALPTGLSANTTYWVIRVDANTFQLATSLANAIAGTAITTSGTQSGVHTLAYGGLSLTGPWLKGNYSGTTITSGYVGQVLTGSAITDNNSTSTTFATISSISMTPGVWMVYYGVTLAITNGASAGNNTYGQLIISDGARVDSSEAIIQGPAGASLSTAARLGAVAIVNLSAAVTYNLQVQHTNVAGTGSGKVYNSSGNGQSVFKAVRIA
jgi:hypothetical protein